MTVRHMVLFRFRPDTEPGLRQTILDRLRELPTHHPEMQRFGLGENVSERDDSFSHVMTMEFASVELLREYLNGERHETLVHNWFAPNVAARAIASYQLT